MGRGGQKNQVCLIYCMLVKKRDTERFKDKDKEKVASKGMIVRTKRMHIAWSKLPRSQKDDKRDKGRKSQGERRERERERERESV